jgi:hypothetical protein
MSKQTYVLTYTGSHGFKHEHSIEAWCSNHAVDQAYTFIQTRRDALCPGLTDPDGKVILSSEEPWW